MIAAKFVTALGVSAALLAVATLAPLTVHGDEVWVQPIPPTSTESDWYPRAIEKLSGDVIDFDHQQLRIRVSGDEAATVIAAARVIWIDPKASSPLEEEAMAFFAERKYSESLSRLPEILKQRPPVWRQQWITMRSAVAAWRSGRSKIALELVAQLDRRPLPPMVIAWLPVAWTNGAQDADAIAAARERIDDPSPAVRLVAGSWLLSSPDRTQAVATLNQLSSSEGSGQRVGIARLAQVLLWRTAPPPKVVESSEAWQQQLGGLPMVWQVGPTRTLIDKLQSAGEKEKAEHLEWSLKLTPIHPHPLSFDF